MTAVSSLAFNPWPPDAVDLATPYTTDGYPQPTYLSQLQLSGIQFLLSDQSWLEVQARHLPPGFSSWEALFADTEELETIIMSTPSRGENIFCFYTLIN